jgi:hypothetical protein
MQKGNDLADMAMFILEKFPLYIEGDANPIDTAMRIMIDLVEKVKMLENKDDLPSMLGEKVIHAGINYVNALEGKFESPFTPAEFLETLKDQIRQVRRLRFGD